MKIREGRIVLEEDVGRALTDSARYDSAESTATDKTMRPTK